MKKELMEVSEVRELFYRCWDPWEVQHQEKTDSKNGFKNGSVVTWKTITANNKIMPGMNVPRKGTTLLCRWEEVRATNANAQPTRSQGRESFRETLVYARLQKFDPPKRVLEPKWFFAHDTDTVQARNPGVDALWAALFRCQGHLKR